VKKKTVYQSRGAFQAGLVYIKRLQKLDLLYLPNNYRRRWGMCNQNAQIGEKEALLWGVTLGNTGWVWEEKNRSSSDIQAAVGSSNFQKESGHCMGFEQNHHPVLFEKTWPGSHYKNYRKESISESV
jgi:hypothetical protein